MSKVIIGNKDFTVPWLELKVFKLVEAQTRVFIISPSFLLYTGTSINQRNSYYP